MDPTSSLFLFVPAQPFDHVRLGFLSKMGLRVAVVPAAAVRDFESCAISSPATAVVDIVAIESVSSSTPRPEGRWEL